MLGKVPFKGPQVRNLKRGPTEETNAGTNKKTGGGGINKSSGQRGHQENISLPRSQAEKCEALPEAGE